MLAQNASARWWVVHFGGMSAGFGITRYATILKMCPQAPVSYVTEPMCRLHNELRAGCIDSVVSLAGSPAFSSLTRGAPRAGDDVAGLAGQ